MTLSAAFLVLKIQTARCDAGFCGRPEGFRDHPLKAASTITDLHKFVVFRKELCSDDVPVLAWQLEAGRSPGAIVEDLRGTCKGSITVPLRVPILHPQCERLCAGPLPSISDL